MGWVEYVSKIKLGVTDNIIVLLLSLHILAQKNNNHEWSNWVLLITLLFYLNPCISWHKKNNNHDWSNWVLLITLLYYLNPCIF